MTARTRRRWPASPPNGAASRSHVAVGLIPQPPLVASGSAATSRYDAGQHAGAGPVEPVQVSQAGPQPFHRVGDLRPGTGVGRLLPGQPVRGARVEQRGLVGEVPVDGQPGDLGRSAMAAMVVAAGPTLPCRATVASTMRRRVWPTCSARRRIRYGRDFGERILFTQLLDSTSRP